jgi:predicted DCC family thiol-disulfide oxidoreductase YuxK
MTEGCAPAVEQDTLYYDGHCSLCEAEMNRLRLHKPDHLQLVDIHQLQADDSLPCRDQLLRNLHFRTADGHFLVGLEANIAAWRQTRFARFWRVLELPQIHSLASLGYRAWAHWRYRRLYKAPVKQ